MHRVNRTVLIVVLALVSIGCTYHRAYVSYSEVDDRIPIRSEGWAGERLGRVSANEGGAIWKECTNVAEGALWVLLEETRRLGGNAIGDVRWFPETPDRASDAPVCRQRWGWFLVWPILATPAFQRAAVEAYAYRIDDAESPPTGTFMIPDLERERIALVERMLADSQARSR
jgi:hypothetical protein